MCDRYYFRIQKLAYLRKLLGNVFGGSTYSSVNKPEVRIGNVLPLD
ncbi:MAG: hypothetical protein HRU18_14015 [Pseudoalteromonas sp.]|nr:hypothetical protein [Pseudoalteromonas sp.]